MLKFVLTNTERSCDYSIAHLSRVRDVSDGDMRDTLSRIIGDLEAARSNAETLLRALDDPAAQWMTEMEA